MEPVYAPGLDNIVACETALSDVDGARGRLLIAGEDIEQLAPRTGFAEIAARLWRAAGLAVPADVDAALGAARVEAFARISSLGRALAAADGMDALRGAVAQLPSTSDLAADAITATGAIAVFAAAWARGRDGLPAIAPDPHAPHAADYLRMVAGEATAARAQALDQYLVAVSDHGMNASTFAARVVASTGSDTISALVAAVGALKGPLHGGAPGPVLDMLDAIAAPDAARAWLATELAAGRRIMGMGHRVYRVRDPRAAVLERAIAELSGAAWPPAGWRWPAPSSRPPPSSCASATRIARWRPTSSSTPRSCSTRSAFRVRCSRRPSRLPARPAGPRTSPSSCAPAA